MRSIKAAGLAMAALALLVPVVAIVSNHGFEANESGTELSRRWLVALYLSHWWHRLMPLLGAVGVGGAALLGALLQPRVTAREERRSLLAWLVLGGSLTCLDAVFPYTLRLAGGYRDFAWWVPSSMLIVGSAVASCVASAVVAVHLQWRLQRAGARLHAWHVGVGALVLALLGPAVLLVGILVWWLSGGPQTELA